MSAATVREIARDAAPGGEAPRLHHRSGGRLVRFLARRGYRILPPTPEGAEPANAPPPHPADAMDRMLVCAAQAEGATNVRSDRIFAVNGVPVL